MTAAMLAYCNGIDRETVVAEMRAHRDAGRLIQGEYDNGKSGSSDWRGSATACAVRTINERLGLAVYYDDHSAVADAFGWPTWLVAIQDILFDLMPIADAREFPVQLAVAIPEGADMTPVLGRFLSRVLREVVLPVSGDCSVIVERVERCWKTAWAEDDSAEVSLATRKAAYAAQGPLWAQRTPKEEAACSAAWAAQLAAACGHNEWEAGAAATQAVSAVAEAAAWPWEETGGTVTEEAQAARAAATYHVRDILLEECRAAPKPGAAGATP